MREIISKQQREYTKFLCDLSIWREGLQNGDWAPWKKPNGESKNYKQYRDTLQEFTLLQSRLPTLIPRQIRIRDKKSTDIVTKLRNLSQDLADQAHRLVEADKTYLFNPLVQVTIFFHIHHADFLERLSEAIKHKPKAAEHGNRKSASIFFSAFLMSEYPGLKARQIHKLLNAPRFRELLRELDIEKKEEWDQESFKRWFSRNRAEIFSLRDRLTGKPT